jgi:hypothetical protein
MNRLANIMIVLLLTLPTTCQATATWTTSKVTIIATIDQAEGTAEFPFVISGDDSVAFTRILPSCGCTIASTNKDVYAPGEKGVLRATVNLGVHTGTATKTIRVYLDGKPKPSAELRITVVIPVPVRARPATLSWSMGSAPDARTIALTIPPEFKAKVTGVKPLRPDIQARIETIKDGKRYRLTVSPDSTQGTFDSEVEIELEVSTASGMVKKVVKLPVRVK